MLELRNLRFSRSAFSLSLDFLLPEKTYGVLLGPSGCGKSTALRIVSGLLRQNAGEIVLGGHRIEDLPPDRRHIGMVFQDYALFPQLSVRRNIEYGPRQSGRDSAKCRRVAEELALSLRIAPLLDRKPSSLSGGEQQRTALARSLAAGPRLLLLDEPLSSLDAALRRELRIEIKESICERGISAIHVTHDLEEALAIADRLYIMDGGKIVAEEKPEELYGKPPSAFVARLLGRGPLIPSLGEEASPNEWGTRIETAFGTFYCRGMEQSATASFLHFAASDPQPVARTSTVRGNRFEGKVLSSVFLGRTRRIALSPFGPGSPIELDIDAAYRPERGEVLLFEILPERCFLLA